MEQTEWIEKAKKGDAQAFYQLISIVKEQLYRTALAYLKDEQEALEAIQEVTYRAYKNIRKLKEPKYFSTWIMRIMMNYCTDELKRKNRFTNQEVSLEVGVEEKNDDRLMMEAAIQRLEPNLQLIIILKYFQDLTIEQIAEQLGHPVGTIKTWLNRALQHLRKELQKGGEFHV